MRHDCDHTHCHAYEAATGITGCRLSWGENYRREGGFPSSLPSSQRPTSSLGARLPGPLPAPFIAPSHNYRVGPPLSQQAQRHNSSDGATYPPGYDPLQGRTPEQWQRNEDLACEVFKWAAAAVALITIIALMGGN